MSRRNDRRDTKTKGYASTKGGRVLKTRYPRTWKKDGRFQPTRANPRFVRTTRRPGSEEGTDAE